MKINRINVADYNSVQNKQAFQGGVKLNPGAKETIMKNLPDFYMGSKPAEQVLKRLENLHINLLRFVGIEKTPQTAELADADIIIHSIHVDPNTKSKFYLYKIPQLGSGFYGIITNKSLLETPVSICRDIATIYHKAEIANRTFWLNKKNAI